MGDLLGHVFETTMDLLYIELGQYLNCCQPLRDYWCLENLHCSICV